MTTTTRRRFLKSAALTAAAVALPARAQRATGKPNILYILADDLGWGDVGFHGSPIQTPNIDRLRAGGVELDQHYVQPMCTPTRVALLTGRYPSRFGDQAVKPCNDRVLPWSTVTLASALSSIGYDTGLAGKWHLGSQPQWGPNHFGFSRSYGSLAGGCGQYNHRYKKGPHSRTWHRNEKLLDEEGHTTDLIAREVVGWINGKKQPWFYYVPFTAVHVPVEVPDRFIKLYAGKTFDKDPAKNESFQRYAAYTTHMDHAIGQMLDALTKTGQRDQTLVIFTSDNGTFPSWRPSGKYPGTYPPCPRLGSNAPLRGYKATLYEGGIRAPTCVYWPGHLKPSKVTTLLHMVDWMPTLTKLCGYRPPRDLKWDGQDIWPIITKRFTPTTPRTLYWKFTGGRRAVRHGDWKLIDLGRKRVELYNLADDPHEKHNLTARHPDKVKQLRAALTQASQADRAKRPPDAAPAPST